MKFVKEYCHAERSIKYVPIWKIVALLVVFKCWVGNQQFYDFWGYIQSISLGENVVEGLEALMHIPWVYYNVGQVIVSKIILG